MDTLNEVMTAQQRIKRAMIMARNRSKIERARERSRARLADAKKIVERAMRLARQIVRKRVVGERGERYEDLSPAEKVEIDKVMQKRKDAIKKVALRLIQQVRKKEFERFKSFYMGKQLDHLHTESVELDVGKLLYEMIEAVQDNIITEADQHLLEAKFGSHEDFDLFKSYFVESLALEEGDSEMAMLRVTLLENLDDWFNEKWVRVDTKGNKPINVATESFIVEKSVPKNPKLWKRAIAWAKSEYDVYPSAYANAGAAKWYKKHGGEWKTISEDVLSELAVYKHGAASQGARSWVRLRAGYGVRAQQKHKADRGQGRARVRYVMKNGKVQKYVLSKPLRQRNEMGGQYSISGLTKQGKAAPIYGRYEVAPTNSKRSRYVARTTRRPM